MSLLRQPRLLRLSYMHELYITSKIEWIKIDFYYFGIILACNFTRNAKYIYHYVVFTGVRRIADWRYHFYFQYQPRDAYREFVNSIRRSFIDQRTFAVFWREIWYKEFALQRLSWRILTTKYFLQRYYINNMLINTFVLFARINITTHLQ